MNFAKKLFDYMGKMSGEAYFFIKICILAACILAAAALGLAIYISKIGFAAYHLKAALNELTVSPAAIILIAAIGSVCIEERCAK